jgi:hypothetical protein
MSSGFGRNYFDINTQSEFTAFSCRGKSNATIKDFTIFSFNIADNIIGICSNHSCEGGAVAARGNSVLQVLDGSLFLRNR